MTTHTVRLILANGAQFHEQVRATSPNEAIANAAQARGYGRSDVYQATVNGKAIQLR